MKPYFAFTGTASVGKTTIVKAVSPLLEKIYGEPLAHIAEVARSLEKLGFKINKEGNMQTQRMIEDEYLRLEGEYVERVKIADRSIIDRYSYTILSVGNVEGDTAEEQELLSWYDSNIVEHCKKYSHIFHIPLTGDVKLELDGVRSSDEKYRKEIADLQQDIITSYGINVHTLTGTTEKRLETIINILETYATRI
jgi:nicotinamide riboside kinase